MADYYWTGTIGGIELTDTDGETCGFELTGADAFESEWKGVTRPGMLGNPHTQYERLIYNKQIELRFLHIPQPLARNLVDLLKDLLPGGEGVECEFVDDFQTITGTFKPADEFYERGQTDAGYLKDFVLRLVNIEA